MTYYAISSICSISVGSEHGGCGVPHVRPLTDDGVPVQPWGVTCAQCETYLATDQHWSRTIAEIGETYDEKIAREGFAKHAGRERDNIIAMAMARLAGIELPAGMAREIGAGPGLQGQMVCPSGHVQAAGMRFCGECGSAMSQAAPQLAVA